MDSDLDEMPESQPHFTSTPSEATKFTIDEGFAEDSQNQLENSRASFDTTASHFQQWIQAQGPDVRAEVAYEILRTLRTSQISMIVDKLMPLLHMDPIEKLPVEVTSMVFTYLDAKTLLTASLASQTWRERILDPRLWQELYRSEGWRVDAREVRAFEEEHASIMRVEFKKARSNFRHSIGKGQPLFKRRATSDWQDSKQRRVSADVATWREQHGVVEADVDNTEGGDEVMQDVGGSALDSPSRPNKRQSNDSGDDEMDYSQDTAATKERTPSLSPNLFNADLLIEDAQGNIKVNWPYLYKQRRKLEDNWNRGKYTNFQLPHPGYVHEAHTECVYTIQFYGKWLVSGSRDKTLRIWDMETRRLRGKPLTGHSQSVLCLQFDPTEEEDVIISGSSDSSVIVWKFSTGQKLHVIPSAHEESVLNLKFDKRFLVTCSKDKKIKIWNRHILSPLDEDYPKFTSHKHAKLPSYVIDIAGIDPMILEARLANGQIKALQPYMHVMTFEGHGAAVNAIQINGDLVVSASGDRLIRVWSIKNGQCLRVIPGHQKGIACVQFDNKRIVSGSSDNSVRVYDLLTGVELAVLLGHQNLVRTVQAGFGDTPGSEEEDLEAAKAAERACLEDIMTGRVVDDRTTLRRIKNGETGSSRTGVGSRLPPGGGGSKWGRIVSGSYDESIIIWKKDAKGQWVPGQTLRQDDAVRFRIEAENLSRNSSGAHNGQGRTRRRPDIPNAQNTMSTTQMVQQAVNASMAGLQTGLQNVMGITRGLNGSWTPSSRPANANASSSAAVSAITPAIQSAVNQIATHAQIAASNVVQQAVNRANVQVHGTLNTSSTTTSQTGQAPSLSVQPQASIVTQTNSTVQTGNVPGSSAAQSAPATPGMAPSQIPGQGQAPAPAPAPAPTTAAAASQSVAMNAADIPNQSNGPQNASVSRVFKLQFDARRIVCCSQDSRIIGWDFANGDAEIETASRFFLGP